MTVTKKTFFVQFSHFFTGQAAAMLLGLVTFPILTRLLSIEQYGILGLVTNTVAMFVVFAKLGLSDGIIRFHEEYMVDNQRKIIFSSTIFTVGLTITFCVSFCYVVLLPWIFSILHIKKQFQLCFLVMSLYLFVRPLSIIFLNLLRVNEKTIFFNALNLVNKVVSVVIGLILLVLVIGELYGYFVGIVIAEYLIFLVLLCWFFKNYKVTFPCVSIGLAKQLMLFGIPLLFTELAYMLLTYADRYMILFYHGETELGLYSVGYNLAMYVANLVAFSVSYAIVPLYVKIYENSGKSETEKFLGDCFYYLLIIIIPVCFGYAAVDKELFIILASDKYIEAASFSPVIVLATVIFGMNSLLNAGLYLHKKSLIILMIISIGIVLNIVCNFVLLPKFHVMGAAISTLVACIAISALTVSLSFRFLAIRIKRGVFYHIFLSIVMYYCLTQISTSRILLDLVLKLFSGVLIILIGILLKEKEMLNRIRDRFSQR